MEIKLIGPTAVLGAAAVVAFGAYRVVTMEAELESEALEELETYLAAEYAGDDVRALSEALASRQPVSRQEAQAATDEILAAQKITFPSVSAHGMWKGREGDDVVVRVEIRVDGGPPPDGEPIRYYRMRYRRLSGWHVGGRTSALSYWLELL